MFVSIFISIFIALWPEYVVCIFLILGFQIFFFFGDLKHTIFVNVP